MQSNQYYTSNAIAQRAAAKSFAQHNTGVSAPLFCACSANRLGAYGQQPFCHQAPVDSNGLRNAQQSVALGPENYQGHYGQAYKLRFPNYNGQFYQATIDTIGQGPVNGAGDVTGNTKPEQVVVLGTKTSPYFRIVRKQTV